eukprot:g3874.t1
MNNLVEKGNIIEAQEMFYLMIEKNVNPDVVTHTTLMKGYIKTGNTRRVFELFEDIKHRALSPTKITFSTIIRACASTGNIKKAQSLYHELRTKYSIKPNAIICGWMFIVCVKAKDLETAKGIFNEAIALEVNVNTFMLSTMIEVYEACITDVNSRQYFTECNKLVEEMHKKGMNTNIEVFTSLVQLCVKGNLTTEAVDVLNKMRSNGFCPYTRTYNIIVDRISRDEKLSIEEMLSLSSKIINDMKEDGILFDAYTYTHQMNVALKAKQLPKTIQLFNQMKQSGIRIHAAAYGVMMKCYEKLGNRSKGMEYLEPCLELWTECQENDIKLDEECYTSLLSACANVSDLSIARKVWNSMPEEGINYNVVHYTAMIKACLAVDEIDAAFGYFDDMIMSDIKPNRVTYRIFVVHFYKKEDKLGARKIYDKIKVSGVYPDGGILAMLRALDVV